MVEDLHSHTYYSFCGGDDPMQLIETAIAGGIEVFGICDHNCGIGHHRGTTEFPDRAAEIYDYQRAVNAYLQHMRLLSEHYRDRITLLCGIEVATCDVKGVRLPKEIDISGFDYCLIEHIDTPTTEVDDLFAFRKRCGTPRAGIAHTDLFSYFAQKGFDPLAFFTRMAEEKIFWEMNVNYDSIHAYREHAYVIDFFADEEKQKIVKQSGVEISVGFDGHRLKDYAPDRVKNACKRLEELGIPMPFASLAKKNGD